MGNDVAHNDKRQVEPYRITPGRLIPECALGGNGPLRSKDLSVIDARNDLEAIAIWLRARAGNSNRTRESYWLHIERLLLWVGEVKKKSISEMNLDDCYDYADFLLDPQPREVWCGPRARRGTPEWRPLLGPLTPSSQRLSLRVVSSLFGFLAASGYFRANPFILMRQKREKTPTNTVERFLDRELIEKVALHLQALPRETQAEYIYYARTRWMFIALLELGLRRDELVVNTQGAIQKKVRPSGVQWWISIEGKGSKVRKIPFPKSCLQALREYRHSMSLDEYPTEGEATPLITSMRNQKSVSANTVYRTIKQLFEDVARTIEDSEPDDAKRLREASPHWLRHSAITLQSDQGVPLKYRQKSAGHSSITMTARYDHAEEDDWYQAMQDGTGLTW